jgi:hypothetical protein
MHDPPAQPIPAPTVTAELASAGQIQAPALTTHDRASGSVRSARYDPSSPDGSLDHQAQQLASPARQPFASQAGVQSAQPASQTTQPADRLAGHVAPAAPPTVKVTIGRIEVRAVPPEPPAARPEPAAPARGLSLHDYLKQRSGGQQ